jgi:hypothetical protein
MQLRRSREARCYTQSTAWRFDPASTAARDRSFDTWLYRLVEAFE